MLDREAETQADPTIFHTALQWARIGPSRSGPSDRLLLWQGSFYKNQQAASSRSVSSGHWMCAAVYSCRSVHNGVLLSHHCVMPLRSFYSSLLPILCILPLTSVCFFSSLPFLFFLLLLSFRVVSRVGVPLSSLSVWGLCFINPVFLLYVLFLQILFFF